MENGLPLDIRKMENGLPIDISDYVPSYYEFTELTTYRSIDFTTYRSIEGDTITESKCNMAEIEEDDLLKPQFQDFHSPKSRKAAMNLTHFQV